MCRLASQKTYRDSNIKKALKDLNIVGENDLLNFRDRKNNNFTHLALKGTNSDAKIDKSQLIEVLNSFSIDSDGEPVYY